MIIWEGVLKFKSVSTYCIALLDVVGEMLVGHGDGLGSEVDTGSVGTTSSLS